MSSIQYVFAEGQRTAALCELWLRKGFDELTHAERLAYARQAAEARSRRDKSIEALKLTPADNDAYNWHEIVAEQHPTVNETDEKWRNCLASEDCDTRDTQNSSI